MQGLGEEITREGLYNVGFGKWVFTQLEIFNFFFKNNIDRKAIPNGNLAVHGDEGNSNVPSPSISIQIFHFFYFFIFNFMYLLIYYVGLLLFNKGNYFYVYSLHPPLNLINQNLNSTYKPLVFDQTNFLILTSYVSRYCLL